MDISVVVPLFNEEESLPELSQWVIRVCAENKLSCEIVFVDDGSTDSSWDVIKQLQKKYNEVRGIRFRRNYGKSAALNTGFDAANGDVVITMDADLQDSPDEIPMLYDAIIKEKYDMVSGWKKKRHDPLGKRIPSKFFNGLTRVVSGIKLHDFNCGLKAYSNEVVKSIEVYGEMHRYIPVIAKYEGYTRIGEKIVCHYPRKFGKSKFGLGRMKGMLDLLTLSFISKFGKRPMHFFGALGSIIFAVGFFLGCYLAYAKIFMMAYRMTDRPLFYLCMLCMVLGSQLFLTGFVSEMISANNRMRNKYNIEERVGDEELGKGVADEI